MVMENHCLKWPQKGDYTVTSLHELSIGLNLEKEKNKNKNFSNLRWKAIDMPHLKRDVKAELQKIAHM